MELLGTDVGGLATPESQESAKGEGLDILSKESQQPYPGMTQDSPQ